MVWGKLPKTNDIYTISIDDGARFGCYASFNRDFWGRNDDIRWRMEHLGNATHINGFITLS